MRFAHVLATLLVVPMLAACPSTPYRYGGKTYTDRQEAEAAHKADIEALRSAYKPRGAPIAKSARVVIPNKTAVLERRVRPVGTAEQRDYAATIYHNDYRLIAENIRYRNIFERFEIEETADPGHATPTAGEVVIYLYMADIKTGGWYYISGATKRTPLHFDTGNPDRAGRFKYFVDSIEALAADEPK